MGVDAALVMVAGQGMVMLHRWVPGEAVVGLLVTSVLVAIPLLYRSASGLHHQRR
jgi:hypothetical protein